MTTCKYEEIIFRKGRCYTIPGTTAQLKISEKKLYDVAKWQNAKNKDQENINLCIYIDSACVVNESCNIATILASERARKIKATWICLLQLCNINSYKLCFKGTVKSILRLLLYGNQCKLSLWTKMMCMFLVRTEYLFTAKMETQASPSSCHHLRLLMFQKILSVDTKRRDLVAFASTELDECL